MIQMILNSVQLQIRLAAILIISTNFSKNCGNHLPIRFLSVSLIEFKGNLSRSSSISLMYQNK